MFNSLLIDLKNRIPDLGRGIGKNGWRWAFYDWANSAFVLCVMTVLGSAWFIALFEQAAEEAGGLRVGSALALPLFGSRWTAEAAWSILVGASAGVAALGALLLGPVVDARGKHKQFALLFCLLGATATVGQSLWPLWSDVSWSWAVIGLLVFIGNVGYESANVFYNAYLPQLTSNPKENARLSSLGYALGYAGGALILLALLIWLVPDHLPTAFLLIGLWWGCFGILSLGWLPATSQTQVKSIFGSLKRSLLNLLKHPHHLRFLLAFLLYNDGIATLISNATPYALQNIYTDASLSQKVGIKDLILMIIIIQVMNIPGTLFLGWLSNRTSEKTTIFICLIAFSITILLAQVIHTLVELYWLAVLIGLFLGGLQAISRSLFASFIPYGREAEYFSFFALSSRFSAMMGPLVFGGLVFISGDTRIALLSLNAFFLAGGVLLAFVNPAQARSVNS